MRLKITTAVTASFENVCLGFTEELFARLSPPFPKVRLLRFDGSGKGDVVELQLDFLFFKQLWTSEIIESVREDSQFHFVDIGVRLPFFLKSWKHKHIVRKKNMSSVIVDDITYSTGYLVSDIIMMPAMYLQFLYRIPVYKQYFKTQTI